MPTEFDCLNIRGLYTQLHSKATVKVRNHTSKILPCIITRISPHLDPDCGLRFDPATYTDP